MDYETFKESVKEDLGKMLKTRGLTVNIQEHHMEKLNSSYDALTITPEDSNIGVNANLSAMYSAVEDGQSYSKVLTSAVNKITEGLRNTPNVDIQDLTNYEVMKDKLSMDVVSAERNAEMLLNIPHERIEDMAVVYRLVLDKNDSGNGTVLVTNKLMEQFGVTKEQLHADAMLNAPEIRPSEIRGMSEVLSEIMGVEMPPGMDTQDEKMFVATVPDKIHGAGVIAYPNFFEEAAEKIGGDYYVLPSSIHEVLLVKDNGDMSVKDLEAMVRDVNETQVAPEEQLTDHVYHYDSKEHVFEMADKYESRLAEKEAEGRESDKDSLLGNLKAKKEEVAKEVSEKISKEVKNKSREGETL